MSKKLLTFITFIILTLVVLTGGFFIYSYTKNTTESGEKPGIVETLKRINPFGSADPLNIGAVIDKILPGNTASSTINNLSGESVGQVLFKLSNERSSGVDFADVKVPITVEVRKKILIDDPRVASGTKAAKISVIATTTEIIYATTTRIRYVEQGSGHIYEYDFASSTERKLTNTTLPKTQEAYFLERGNKVLLRYLDPTNKIVENYLATIPTSSVTDNLSGVFLPNNISSISVSPNTSEFFYIAKTSSGSVGNIYNTQRNTERRVFNSAFSEWLPNWVDQNIFLTTKANSSYLGSVYTQSLSKNTFSKTFSNIYGLTSLSSPDSSKVLLGNGVNLSILNTQTNTTLKIADVFTLPEKCIWHDSRFIICFGQEYIPEGAYPEAWYQGKTFFNDSVLYIDSNTGLYTFLGLASFLHTQEIQLDAINPRISPDKKSLVFLNKLDMTPWYLNLGKLLDFINSQNNENF